VAHELGHLMGLPDLYSYDANSYWTQNLPNIFSTMGTLQGSESDSLKWNKFILRWLSESQVQCFDPVPEYSAIKLTANSSVNSQEIELVLIKLSDNKILAIESIPLEGFFSHSQQDGFLVYTVDTSVRTGNGPIVIIPRTTTVSTSLISPKLPDWVRLTNAPLIPGTFLTYNGIYIENADNSLVIKSGEAARAAEAAQKLTTVRSLKCIKGRTVKTIRAIEPKCPIGYTIYKK
jgi:hypothetical protein